MGRDCNVVTDRNARQSNPLKSTVFEAWSSAALLKRWLACPTMTMPICEMDFREGGRWRRVLHDPSHGVDHPTSGEFQEIVPCDRMVFTERCEPIPESEHLVTLTFEERGGTTIFSQRILHATKEGRDAHLKSGMTNGLQEIFLRLESMLASMSDHAAETAP